MLTMLFYILLIFLLLIAPTFRMNVKKFATVNIICGLPGAGKSTCAAYFTKHFNKKKYKEKDYRVYSNVPIEGAYPYDFKEDFGTYDMSNAAIILDEAGLVANNRDFKNFKYTQLEYLKLLRHRFNIKFVFSQTWDDMDLKIRSMAGMIWICKKSTIPYVTKLVPVKRSIGVDENDKQMKDIYYIDHPILRIFTTRRFIRPLYYKMFDSYEAPYLPPYPPERETYQFKRKDSQELEQLNTRLGKQVADMVDAPLDHVQDALDSEAVGLFDKLKNKKINKIRKILTFPAYKKAKIKIK